jgi:hypothetical protein
MRKRHGALRADTLRVVANPGKERAVLRFVTDYRRLAMQVCSGDGSPRGEQPTNTLPPSI